MQTQIAHDTPLLAFGALPELLDLRRELATWLRAERQVTAEKGFKEQFLSASRLYASWLRREPVCAGVLPHFCAGSSQWSLLRSSVPSCAPGTGENGCNTSLEVFDSPCRHQPQSQDEHIKENGKAECPQWMPGLAATNCSYFKYQCLRS